MNGHVEMFSKRLGVVSFIEWTLFPIADREGLHHAGILAGRHGSNCARVESPTQGNSNRNV